MPAKTRETWYLLRGLARDSSHWNGFDRELGGKFGVKVLGIDLPGAGRFHRLRSPLTLAGIVDFVRGQYLLAEEAAPSKRRRLLGVSLGGMVALEWMTRYPADVDGGVVINASCSGLVKPWQRLRPEALMHLARAIKTKSLYERELHILGITSQKKEGHPAIAQAWARQANEAPFSHENLVRQLTAASRFRLAKQMPEAPVLYINSLGDELVDPHCSVAIADHWQIEVERHPWGGHDLTLDDPEWVLARIEEWLEKK